MKTQIFLLKDIENVGMAGEIVGVAAGFAANYILPHKLGIIVNESNKAEFAKRLQKIEKRNEVIKSKTSMLAEKIKSVKLTVKAKMDQDGKLYGAIRPQAIVEGLATQGISIGKSMVVFDKQIKDKGTYEVTIKLSSSLQPKLTVKVIAEA